MEIKDKKILIHEKDKQMAYISILQIKIFSLDGKGERLNQLIPDTDEKRYDGVFEESNQAEAFVNHIRKISRCCIDISLEECGGK